VVAVHFGTELRYRPVRLLVGCRRLCCGARRKTHGCRRHGEGRHGRSLRGHLGHGLDSRERNHTTPWHRLRPGGCPLPMTAGLLRRRRQESPRTSSVRSCGLRVGRTYRRTRQPPSSRGSMTAVLRTPRSPSTIVRAGSSRRAPTRRASTIGAVAEPIAYGAGGHSFGTACEMASSRWAGTLSVSSVPSVVAADHPTTSAGGRPATVNSTDATPSSSPARARTAPTTAV